MVVNFNIYQNSKNYKKASPARQSFTGLHHALEKKVYNSAETIAEMASYFKREDGQVGNLPKEMILLMKQNCSDLSQGIKLVKTAFTDVADILTPIATDSIENLKKTDYANIEKEIVSLLETAPKNEIEKIDYSAFVSKNMRPNPSSFANIKIKAEAKLTGVMRQVGIVPPSGRVGIKYLDYGMYGTAYKISFLDGNSKEQLNGKVLKVYKDRDVVHEQISASLNKTGGLFVYLKENKSVEKFFSAINNNKNLSEKEKVIVSTNLGTGQDVLTRLYEPKRVQRLIESLTDSVNIRRSDFHGVLSESNAALYIKKHLRKDIQSYDIVTPYFFDYNHKFGLYEMADINQPKPTKFIDFSKLKLKHCDLKNNPGNVVGGRIIDFGGIKSMDHQIY